MTRALNPERAAIEALDPNISLKALLQAQEELTQLHTEAETSKHHNPDYDPAQGTTADGQNPAWP